MSRVSKHMNIRKRDTRKQAETGDSDESGDKQPRCSKCGKRLESNNTKGICKHCEAKVEGHRAAILAAAAAVGGRCEVRPEGRVSGDKSDQKVTSFVSFALPSRHLWVFEVPKDDGIDAFSR